MLSTWDKGAAHRLNFEDTPLIQRKNIYLSFFAEQIAHEGEKSSRIPGETSPK